MHRGEVGVSDQDEGKLSNLQIYMVRMVVFLMICAFLGFIVFRQVLSAFVANPFLNGLILFTLIIGIAYAFRQVLVLRPEIRWVNAFRVGDPGLEISENPKLLAPMATLLRERSGRMQITPDVLRSILDSIASRLDEARDISRYLIGLLVFLGLLGTFWGLLETVSSVADTINALDGGAGDAGLIFEDLKNGLQAPLSGMGTAFSSSLFGLAGSLILGFLDLQAGQAQNRFYTGLEDWLSGVTQVESDVSFSTSSSDGSGLQAIHDNLRQLNSAVSGSGGNRNATAAMADLAEGIQGLVQHMRAEQKTVREWVETQASQQREIKELLRILAEQNEQRR
ncbi:MAG: flagellar motor protein MotA [Pseudomonadota bacterium]